MSQIKEATNPFYVVLLVVGMVFFVTACAYGVMSFKAVRGGPAAMDEAGASGLMVFMEEHGNKLLAGELLILAVATFGAIGSDSYWNRRAQRRAGRLPMDQTTDPAGRTGAVVGKE